LIAFGVGDLGGDLCLSQPSEYWRDARRRYFVDYPVIGPKLFLILLGWGMSKTDGGQVEA
jgi:hypothetical protein